MRTVVTWVQILRLPAMIPPMIVRDVLLLAMPQYLLRHFDEPLERSLVAVASNLTGNRKVESH